MFNYWMKNNIDKNYVKNTKDQENFRHFKSKLNHRDSKTGKYPVVNREDVFKWIDDTTRLDFKYKELYRKFILDYEKWHNNDYKKIVVPHIILTNFEIDDVPKVFEKINSTGKKLNKFEVSSANWSKHRILIAGGNNNFINIFLEKRKQKYKDEFIFQSDIHSNFINYDNSEVIPSNFIYAIFEESIKDHPEFKYSFL